MSNRHGADSNRLMKQLFFGFIVILLYSPVHIMSLPRVNFSEEVDQRSYWLGSINSFSEMVAVGLKKLALSPAISPEEMDRIEADILAIAASSGIKAYRENDLIVTDLFPADVAKGKDVMLLYKGSTLDEYLALKQEKARLVKSDEYRGEARREIAMRFGRLLSYPDSYLKQKLD